MIEARIEGEVMKVTVLEAELRVIAQERVVVIEAADEPPMMQSFFNINLFLTHAYKFPKIILNLN